MIYDRNRLFYMPDGSSSRAESAAPRDDNFIEPFFIDDDNFIRIRKLSERVGLLDFKECFNFENLTTCPEVLDFCINTVDEFLINLHALASKNSVEEIRSLILEKDFNSANKNIEGRLDRTYGLYKGNENHKGNVNYFKDKLDEPIKLAFNDKEKDREDTKNIKKLKLALNYIIKNKSIFPNAFGMSENNLIHKVLVLLSSKDNPEGGLSGYEAGLAECIARVSNEALEVRKNLKEMKENLPKLKYEKSEGKTFNEDIKDKLDKITKAQEVTQEEYKKIKGEMESKIKKNEEEIKKIEKLAVAEKIRAIDPKTIDASAITESAKIEEKSVEIGEELKELIDVVVKVINKEGKDKETIETEEAKLKEIEGAVESKIMNNLKLKTDRAKAEVEAAIEETIYTEIGKLIYSKITVTDAVINGIKENAIKAAEVAATKEMTTYAMKNAAAIALAKETIMNMLGEAATEEGITIEGEINTAMNKVVAKLLAVEGTPSMVKIIEMMNEEVKKAEAIALAKKTVMDALKKAETEEGITIEEEKINEAMNEAAEEVLRKKHTPEMVKIIGIMNEKIKEKEAIYKTVVNKAAIALAKKTVMDVLKGTATEGGITAEKEINAAMDEVVAKVSAGEDTPPMVKIIEMMNERVKEVAAIALAKKTLMDALKDTVIGKEATAIIDKAADELVLDGKSSTVEIIEMMNEEVKEVAAIALAKKTVMDALKDIATEKGITIEEKEINEAMNEAMNEAAKEVLAERGELLATKVVEAAMYAAAIALAKKTVMDALKGTATGKKITTEEEKKIYAAMNEAVERVLEEDEKGEDELLMTKVVEAIRKAAIGAAAIDAAAIDTTKIDAAVIDTTKIDAAVGQAAKIDEALEVVKKDAEKIDKGIAKIYAPAVNVTAIKGEVEKYEGEIDKAAKFAKKIEGMTAIDTVIDKAIDAAIAEGKTIEEIVDEVKENVINKTATVVEKEMILGAAEIDTETMDEAMKYAAAKDEAARDAAAKGKYETAIGMVEKDAATKNTIIAKKAAKDVAKKIIIETLKNDVEITKEEEKEISAVIDAVAREVLVEEDMPPMVKAITMMNEKLKGEFGEKYKEGIDRATTEIYKVAIDATKKDKASKDTAIAKKAAVDAAKKIIIETLINDGKITKEEEEKIRKTIDAQAKEVLVGDMLVGEGMSPVVKAITMMNEKLKGEFVMDAAEIDTAVHVVAVNASISEARENIINAVEGAAIIIGILKNSVTAYSEEEADNIREMVNEAVDEEIQKALGENIPILEAVKIINDAAIEAAKTLPTIEEPGEISRIEITKKITEAMEKAITKTIGTPRVISFETTKYIAIEATPIVIKRMEKSKEALKSLDALISECELKLGSTEEGRRFNEIINKIKKGEVITEKEKEQMRLLMVKLVSPEYEGIMKKIRRNIPDLYNLFLEAERRNLPKEAEILKSSKEYSDRYVKYIEDKIKEEGGIPKYRQKLEKKIKTDKEELNKEQKRFENRKANTEEKIKKNLSNGEIANVINDIPIFDRKYILKEKPKDARSSNYYIYGNNIGEVAEIIGKCVEVNLKSFKTFEKEKKAKTTEEEAAEMGKIEAAAAQEVENNFKNTFITLRELLDSLNAGEFYYKTTDKIHNTIEKVKLADGEEAGFIRSFIENIIPENERIYFISLLTGYDPTYITENESAAINNAIGVLSELYNAAKLFSTDAIKFEKFLIESLYDKFKVKGLNVLNIDVRKDKINLLERFNIKQNFSIGDISEGYEIEIDECSGKVFIKKVDSGTTSEIGYDGIRLNGKNIKVENVGTFEPLIKVEEELKDVRIIKKCFVIVGGEEIELDCLVEDGRIIKIGKAIPTSTEDRTVDAEIVLSDGSKKTISIEYGKSTSDSPTLKLKGEDARELKIIEKRFVEIGGEKVECLLDGKKIIKIGEIGVEYSEDGKIIKIGEEEVAEGSTEVSVGIGDGKTVKIKIEETDGSVKLKLKGEGDVEDKELKLMQKHFIIVEGKEAEVEGKEVEVEGKEVEVEYSEKERKIKACEKELGRKDEVIKKLVVEEDGTSKIVEEKKLKKEKVIKRTASLINKNNGFTTTEELKDTRVPEFELNGFKIKNMFNAEPTVTGSGAGEIKTEVIKPTGGDYFRIIKIEKAGKILPVGIGDEKIEFEVLEDGKMKYKIIKGTEETKELIEAEKETGIKLSDGRTIKVENVGTFEPLIKVEKELVVTALKGATTIQKRFVTIGDEEIEVNVYSIKDNKLIKIGETGVLLELDKIEDGVKTVDVEIELSDGSKKTISIEYDGIALPKLKLKGEGAGGDKELKQIKKRFVEIDGKKVECLLDGDKIIKIGEEKVEEGSTEVSVEIGDKTVKIKIEKTGDEDFVVKPKLKLKREGVDGDEELELMQKRFIIVGDEELELECSEEGKIKACEKKLGEKDGVIKKLVVEEDGKSKIVEERKLKIEIEKYELQIKEEGIERIPEATEEPKATRELGWVPNWEVIYDEERNRLMSSDLKLLMKIKESNKVGKDKVGKDKIGKDEIGEDKAESIAKNFTRIISEKSNSELKSKVEEMEKAKGYLANLENELLEKKRKEFETEKLEENRRILNMFRRGEIQKGDVHNLGDVSKIVREDTTNFKAENIIDIIDKIKISIQLLNARINRAQSNDDKFQKILDAKLDKKRRKKAKLNEDIKNVEKHSIFNPFRFLNIKYYINKLMMKKVETLIKNIEILKLNFNNKVILGTKSIVKDENLGPTIFKFLTKTDLPFGASFKVDYGEDGKVTGFKYRLGDREFSDEEFINLCFKQHGIERGESTEEDLLTLNNKITESVFEDMNKKMDLLNIEEEPELSR